MNFGGLRTVYIIQNWFKTESRHGDYGMYISIDYAEQWACKFEIWKLCIIKILRSQYMYLVWTSFKTELLIVNPMLELK